MPAEPTREHDVLVVGAGVSGLACALDLCAAGLDVLLVEQAEAVGGRVRTDRRDGFLLDHGFQVFNTSYPQVKRRLRLAELRLRPFTPGVLVQTPRGRMRFTDPTRRPRAAADLLPGRLGSGRDIAALGLLGARDMLLPPALLRRGRDTSTRSALAAAGISPALVEDFLRPFLSGVFLEEELETSARYFHLVWRSMLRGTLCLPDAGIGAVPAQLAAGLPAGVLRLGTPVRELTAAGAALADGTELPARAVVVATGPGAAAALLPGLAVPATRTVTTLYHAAPVPPLAEPTLLVDSARRVLNTVVLSEVAPGYATDGRALVSTSVLGAAADGREAEVRSALAGLYGTDTSDWEHLASYTVREALPAMPAPWPLIRSSRFGAGRYVCGDHRATGSLQGAMASGTRAAREVLQELGR
ncbi:NAD(P)/FAD-dependent oxidoreductase [Streptomyces sp. CB03911]|uniref:NAD(P)/FAD-dependent oxidoreductase n=1 Tax=Streptomyces sp. CB03911 TaxID=1804758 RepID=UPI00093BCA32|nr:NAD(P)/FAD-dependent oxidoreductase [Streptomyces sp. CB03911]OKI12447.1 amine oxidase [Streptomyces sp. CB03911]